MVWVWVWVLCGLSGLGGGVRVDVVGVGLSRLGGRVWEGVRVDVVGVVEGWMGQWMGVCGGLWTYGG